MSDELKDQRIPIMMTASEVKAIDDWMFANRIKSRAEAIRRLCQLGIVADRIAPELGGALSDLGDKIHVLEAGSRSAESDNQKDDSYSLDIIISSYKEHMNFVSRTMLPITHLQSSVYTYKGINAEKDGKIYNAHEVLDAITEHYKKLQREAIEKLDLPS